MHACLCVCMCVFVCLCVGIGWGQVRGWVVGESLGDRFSLLVKYCLGFDLILIVCLPGGGLVSLCLSRFSAFRSVSRV